MSVGRRFKQILKRQRVADPLSLLDYGRLDVASKTPYARAVIEKNTSEWPKELYKEVLRAWNNFYEESPKKTKFSDFDRSFKSIIQAMQTGTFNSVRSPVFLDDKKRLTTGSHRVAAAIVTNTDIQTKHSSAEKAGFWDHDYFRYWAKADGSNGLAEEYIDAMVIEYVSIKPRNLRAIILFPSAIGRRQEAAEYIGRLGTIVGYKKLRPESLNPMTTIGQLYADEWWCNNEYREAWKYKADGCFNGNDDLEVYIIDTAATDEALQVSKTELRSWWQVQNHSIHITDTESEVLTVSRMFFNQNSRDFLSVAQNVQAPKFDRYIERFLQLLPENTVERDRFCVDSSSVLAAFGIRDAQDLDYLHRGEGHLQYYGEDINQHGDDEAAYYPDTVDEIITNPRHHFYYRGVKFASLHEVEVMKRARAEKKDKADLKLIAAFKKANPVFKKK